VGKSTLSYALARRTGWAVVAKDGIDRTCERLDLAAWPPIAAYQIMLDLADLNLRHGVSLILDAVFAKSDFQAAGNRHCGPAPGPVPRHRVPLQRSCGVAAAGGRTPRDGAGVDPRGLG